jgi:hypothetical protein
MQAHRVLFVSLSALLVGAAFAVPAFAQQSGAANTGSRQTLMPAYSDTQRYAPDNFAVEHLQGSSRPPAGYACTWSGSRDLARGETAYQRGQYESAVAQWKTAASKDCAVAAYKLGALYYDGNADVVADRSLGAAWLRVAAESGTANSPYYLQTSQRAVANLTQPQHARYVEDYARLSADRGAPAAR